MRFFRTWPFWKNRTRSSVPKIPPTNSPDSEEYNHSLAPPLDNEIEYQLWLCQNEIENLTRRLEILERKNDGGG